MGDLDLGADQSHKQVAALLAPVVDVLELEDQDAVLNSAGSVENQHNLMVDVELSIQNPHCQGHPHGRHHDLHHDHPPAVVYLSMRNSQELSWLAVPIGLADTRKWA